LADIARSLDEIGVGTTPELTQLQVAIRTRLVRNILIMLEESGYSTDAELLENGILYKYPLYKIFASLDYQLALTSIQALQAIGDK